MESQEETVSYLFLLIFLSLGYAGGNTVSLVSSSPGLAGHSLQLMCQLNSSGSYNLWKVNWYLNNYTNAIERNAANCDPVFSPEYDISRYTFSCNPDVFILTINALSQTDDGNCWKCSVAFTDALATDTASTCITVGHVALQSNNKVPTQGNSLQFSCLVDTVTNTKYTTYWFSPSATSEPDGNCYIEQKFCTGGSSTHIFKADEHGSYIDISRLNRTQDEGRWRCKYNGETSHLLVIIYTIPEGLNITQDGDGNIDLSMTSTVLRCRTNGCTYPAPLIQWLYKNQSASSPYEVYITDNPTQTVGSCVSPEQFYTSTLVLKQNTTLKDNSDMTFIFSCRIEYLDPSRNLIAVGSKTVRFAVKVLEAVLQHNNQNSIDIVNVTSGFSVTLTCVIGACRPAATIDWYIGSQRRASEKPNSLTFIPSDADHDKIIYCQAYNTDPSQPVSSQKPKIFVNVQVTEAVLQHNNKNITNTVNVTSGLYVTLTCMTGTSRPAATIDWYIGIEKKGNGTSLTFIPSKTDHNKMIYCQAYNTDPSQPVSSQKASLFVKDCEDIVYIEPYLEAKAVEGTSLTLTCSHKCFNNPSVVMWYRNNATAMPVFITSCKGTPEPDYEINRYIFNCSNPYTLTIIQTTINDDRDIWGCSLGIIGFPSPDVKRITISITKTISTMTTIASTRMEPERKEDTPPVAIIVGSTIGGFVFLVCCCCCCSWMCALMESRRRN